MVTPCGEQGLPAQANRNPCAAGSGVSCRMQNRSAAALPETRRTMVCAGWLTTEIVAAPRRTNNQPADLVRAAMAFRVSSLISIPIAKGRTMTHALQLIGAVPNRRLPTEV